MVFSSAIFLFIFLPLTFVIYNITPGITLKNIILTIASLIFYSFGQPIYILLLMASVTINYLAGVLLSAKPSKLKQEDASGWAPNTTGTPTPTASLYGKSVLAIAVIANVGLLAVFKYLDFAILNVNGVFGTAITPTGITLPIGISFYTFQGMSYIVDVYRDRTLGTKNYLKLLLYISFFPQLIAGPIVKYHDIANYIDNRQCTIQKTAEGLRRFIFGLSKKLLIANTMGAIADSVYALDTTQLDIRLAWAGAICYTLQIYFDFSGYSDMAIGLGKMFGFHFLENFNYPYRSSTIKEFWRRWHISLSSWFRDYLYFPLGGSYCSKAKMIRNKFTVFFTTGLWHGANWTFILWGLWHGVFSVLEESRYFPKKWLENRALGHIYTMLVVILGFVLFRASSLTQAGHMFSHMFAGFTFTEETNELFAGLITRSNVIMTIIAIIFSIDIIPKLAEKFSRTTASADDAASHQWLLLPWAEVVSYVSAFALLVLDIMNLSSTSFNPFIYFQF